MKFSLANWAKYSKLAIRSYFHKCIYYYFLFKAKAQYLLQFHQERCDLNKISKGTEMAIGDKYKKHARQIQNLPRVYINI